MCTSLTENVSQGGIGYTTEAQSIMALTNYDFTITAGNPSLVLNHVVSALSQPERFKPCVKTVNGWVSSVNVGMVII